MITNKIDFAIIIGVKNANPNGDPLNGNRPRQTYEGHGEMSDVSIKRKIRDRLLDSNENILVQSDNYRKDAHRSIKDRYDEAKNKKIDKKADSEAVYAFSCQEWLDVRSFGQVFAGVDDTHASIAIRGPISIQSAFSIEPVDITSMQITKTVNLTTNKKDPGQKSGDTMGMKHRVDKAIYVTYGSINKQLSEKTGFSDEDAEKIKQAMTKLFENDESSARPAGSMEVLKLIWWTHDKETLSSAKVHRSLTVEPDGTYDIDKSLPISVEEIEGI